jgi:hypothetical protein
MQRSRPLPEVTLEKDSNSNIVAILNPHKGYPMGFRIMSADLVCNAILHQSGRCGRPCKCGECDICLVTKAFWKDFYKDETTNLPANLQLLQ